MRKFVGVELNRQNKALIAVVSTIVILFGIWYYLSRNTVAVLEPRGPIAAQEKHLLIIATLLMLIVVIPVFVLTFGIAWKYRATNTKKTKYTPDWDRNRGLEAIWWSVPLCLIVALSVITWRSSHTLDPYKPLVSSVQPLNVQVVALQWKWLFIYPEEHVATINYLPIPVNRPVNFEITSDSAMNSFWIPQLGGQIYAMNGMTAQLHLLASQSGDYEGRSSNISGEGFSHMYFKAHATSAASFTSWVQKTHASNDVLTSNSLASLEKPEIGAKPQSFDLQTQALYGTIINKYAGPGTGMSGMDMSDVQ